MKELRNTLANVFEELDNGEVGYKEASVLASLANQVIKSATAQLQYYSIRGKCPKIRFLEEKRAPGKVKANNRKTTKL